MPLSDQAGNVNMLQVGQTSGLLLTMDTIYSAFTMYLVECYAVVEFLFLLVRIMPQPVPLTTALCVHGPYVIIYDPRCSMNYLSTERLPVKARLFLRVERPIEGYSGASLDLQLGCLQYNLIGEPVQRTELVLYAIESPRRIRRMFRVQRQLVKAGYTHSWVCTRENESYQTRW